MAFKMKGHELPGPHQRKSPAKCPLLAAAPAIIGAVGALKKKKEEDSPAKQKSKQSLSETPFTVESAKEALRNPIEHVNKLDRHIAKTLLPGYFRKEILGPSKEKKKGSTEKEKSPAKQTKAEKEEMGLAPWEKTKWFKETKDWKPGDTKESTKSKEPKSPAKRADVYIDGKNIGTGPKARAAAIDKQIKADKKGERADVKYTKKDKEVMESEQGDVEWWKGEQRKDPSLKKYKTREEWRNR